MDFDLAYPALSDLRRRAQRRVPHFAWEYLDSATGDESTHHRNHTALDAIRLLPQVLKGSGEPDLSVRMMGREYPLPFGIAPVGMSGLMWPDAERILARLAEREGIPYCLSTVTAKTPEQVGPHAGTQGWFQLYPPGDPEIRQDLLKRARDAGFHTLILTVDVPVASRRERQRRARLTNPMRMTLPVILQAAFHPSWSLGILAEGIPRLATLEKYTRIDTDLPSTAHIGYLMRTVPDCEYLDALRKEWDGPLVVKGILDEEGAKSCVAAGADAIWVSNHGGRQFDAAPAAIERLPKVRAALGPDVPIIFDSGIRSATDILRAIALGADFTMLGRGFHYGVSAFGRDGAAHVVHILREGLRADMGQLGIFHLEEVRNQIA